MYSVMGSYSPDMFTLISLHRAQLKYQFSPTLSPVHVDICSKPEVLSMLAVEDCKYAIYERTQNHII